MYLFLYAAIEVNEWKQPKGQALPRCLGSIFLSIYLSILFFTYINITIYLSIYLGELLTAIPEVVGVSVAREGSITTQPLDIHSSPSDIKKAYVKALRLVRHSILYIVLFYI
jgi:hypothetical protein